MMFTRAQTQRPLGAGSSALFLSLVFRRLVGGSTHSRSRIGALAFNEFMSCPEGVPADLYPTFLGPLWTLSANLARSLLSRTLPMQRDDDCVLVVVVLRYNTLVQYHCPRIWLSLRRRARVGSTDASPTAQHPLIE
jgi:hypothetical protein